MRANFRSYLRNILSRLTQKVIAKHQPTIISITGTGETSVARELIFEVINSNYPARRNLETPEAEFSVPLAVINYPRYPRTGIEWLWVIIKTYLQLQRLQPFSHFLILELDTVDLEIQKYWIDVLQPKVKLITGPDQKIILANKTLTPKQLSDSLENYKDLAIRIGSYFDVDKEIAAIILEDLEFPRARIDFLKGVQGAVIVDATHYYFPISIKAVLELVATPDRKIIFTDNPSDLQYLELVNWQNLFINPKNYSPQPDDTVILRGLKTKILRKFNHLIRHQ